MDCSSFRKSVSVYVDDAVTAEDRRPLERHLNACVECTLEAERYSRIREKLRTLPARIPPADLAIRLRVVASQVRMERGAGPWRRWLGRMEMSLRDLMRPVALPAVGGLCTAIFLFSIFVPMFKSAFIFNDSGDIPTILTTQPSLRDVEPMAAFSQGDAVVDLKLDGQGQIVDYKIVSAPGQNNDVLRRSIENSLLFTQFYPATTFGRPVASTIRISFRSNRIDVRG